MTKQLKLSDIPSDILTEAERQHAILSRGVVHIEGEKKENKDGLFWKLVKSLQENKPLKIKLGADPTAPDIHLGHSVIINKLRQFQDCGHIVQFLIGDATALVGDPTGRNKTRPPLTQEQIDANAETYLEQVFKILKKDSNLFQLLRNSTWLNELNFPKVISLCSLVTHAQIVAREDFKNRIQEKISLGIHEMLYPIMQGYDSVAMECDIELGGTDQTFNCLMGRQLMERYNMEPQIVMTLPLLEGTDGVEKMSKSKNNYIGVQDDPIDMFGKIMSIPDEIMERYFTLLTDIDLESLPEHPMEAKKLLGRTIVTLYHGEDAAKTAQEKFDERFGSGRDEIPEDLPESTISLSEGKIGLIELVVELNFAESKGAARRLITAGAIRKDQVKITDFHTEFSGEQEFVLQAGKKKIAKVTLKNA